MVYTNYEKTCVILIVIIIFVILYLLINHRDYTSRHYDNINRELPSTSTKHRIGLKPRWVICCAFLLEYDSLIKCFDHPPKEYIEYGIKYAVGTIQKLPCILCNVGISIVNASRGSQFIIDLIGPSQILGMIFMGIAGSVNKNIKDGDVICPESWVYYGHQLYREYGSQTTSLIEGLPISYQPPFRCDNSEQYILKTYQLTENGTENYIKKYRVDRRLYKIAKSINLEYFKTGGIGLSAPIFQADPTYINYLKSTISQNLTIVDEETTAIAHTCIFYQIPWIGIRLVSDVEVNGSNESIQINRLQQACSSLFISLNSI